MLTNAVIIILREVLEAALIASFLLAISKQLKLSFKWFYLAIPLGILGASIYAGNLKSISILWEYRGQELLNSAFKVGIYLLLASLTIIISSTRQESKNKKMLALFMLLPISLAITQEGAEIFVYLNGASSGQQIAAVTMGGLIGFGIGISVGVLSYFSLLMLKPKLQGIISKIAICILATGLLSQIAPLLIQADIFTARPPVWDSSLLLPENAVLGQMLYVIIGYEATPPPEQVILYLLGLLFIIAGIAWQKSRRYQSTYPHL